MPQAREQVIRLTRYKNALEKLKNTGLARVFSDNIADMLGLSAALVRKDFSQFGLSGHKRGGYRVDDLLAQINRLLGSEEPQHVIIVGCGKIGTALLNYTGFSRQRIRIVAGFDTNPAKLDPHAPIPILNLSQMPDVIASQNVRFAILAVPEAVAADLGETLIKLGIRGILNFTPMPLKETPGCVIHNINIALELENLIHLARFLIRPEKGEPGETRRTRA